MTACKPIVLSTAAALTTVVMTTSSFAVSLRPNKATDDSVCDLTHTTRTSTWVEDLVPSVAHEEGQGRRVFPACRVSLSLSKCRERASS
jgi:hypothetical protein